MTIKSGFTIKPVGKGSIRGRIDVYFKRFNGKIVKCWLYDHLLEATYIGMARCHPNDSFNEESGMDLAFGRAVKKRDRAAAVWAKNLVNRMKFYQDDVRLMTESKYARMKSKGKLSCSPRAQAV